MRKHTLSFLSILSVCLFVSTISFGQLHYESLIFDGQGQPQLTNITSAATSPDGNHLYATSYNNDAINIYTRNTTTGSLTFEAAYTNGEQGISGMGGAYSVLVSPDGNHVYVAGSSDNAIAVLKRNPSDGDLTFVEEERNGINNVVGLAGVISISFSPDGNFIYACGADENSLVVFKRNVLTGELTFIERHQDNSGSIQHMSYPVSCMISPDGTTAYVASYDEQSVVVFQRNPSTGQLSYLEEQVNGTGGLSGLLGLFNIYISPDSKHVYTAGSDDASIVVFSRNQTTGALSFVEKLTDGTNGIDGLSGVVAITTSPDGEFLYANGAYEDKIAVFSRDTNTGELFYIGVFENVDGVSYPISIHSSSDGENIYVAGFYADAIVVFDRNTITGDLVFMNKEIASADGIDGLGGASAIAVSPDGKHAYACGKDDDALAALSRNGSTGHLAFIEKYADGINGVDGLNGADDLVISPDGKHIYVNSFWDHAVAVFDRDASTGVLTYVERYKDGVSGVDGLNGANAVAISPDGKNVYAVAYWEHGLSVFDRNETDGKLSFKEVFKDNTGGVDGLSRPSDVIVSPDGKQVYVTSIFDNAIAVFNRNTTDGTLTYMERHKDGLNGVDGVRGASGVAISPDGQQVFVAGTNDNAIAIFDRNTDGTLNYDNMVQNGVDNVGGIEKVNAIIVDSEGGRVYATSAQENSVVVFKRNATTGELTFEKMQRDGVDEVNGLSGANNIALSSDGRYIYTSSSSDNAVAVFSCTYLLNMEELICEGDSVVVGGSVYKTSGLFKDTFSLGSCRTIIELDLSVMPAVVEAEAAICAGGSYIFGGNAYTTAGTYTHAFSSVSGCDSTVNLSLSVVNEFATTVEEAICAGSIYQLGTQSYNSAGTYTETFQTTAGCDSTVTLHLSVNNTYDILLTEIICAGEFYVFGSSNYVNSGIYTQELIASTGCDSTITLDLTVVNPDQDVINKTICEGDVFEIGNSQYSQAGTYTETIVTSNGCQTEITLHLSTNPAPIESIEESICEGQSFTFQNETLTTAGIYTYVYTAANGCDSTLILNLSVRPNSYNITLDETICEGESYEMGGTLYTTTGTYQATLPTQSGCGDSTIVLNLNVEPIATTVDAAICEGESYSIGGQNYSLTGTYVNTITTSNGCETEVTLHLQVHPAYIQEEIVKICDGESIVFGNEVLTMSGTYIDTFATVHGGCDSIVHLQLTVHPAIEGEGVVINDDGTNNGSILLNVSGGALPYTFLWNTGQVSQNLNNLPAGNYSVTITDINNCQVTFNFEVEISTNLFELDELPIQLNLTPNLIQSNQEMHLLLVATESHQLAVDLLDYQGRILMQRQLQINVGQQSHILKSPNSSGFYLLRIRNQEGAIKTVPFIVQ